MAAPFSASSGFEPRKTPELLNRYGPQIQFPF
jgi:hypothetical protein